MDFRRYFSERRLQKPLTLLPPCLANARGSWVDLGCGNGIFSVVLAGLLSPPSTVLAVDRDMSGLRSLLDVQRSLNPAVPIHPLQGDFRDPLPVANLDGMLFANSLHYLPTKSRETALERMVVKLKAGGQLIIVEYNTQRSHPAIPFPLDEIEFHRLARLCGLTSIRIAARAPSSFGGEMFAGTAFLN